MEPSPPLGMRTALVALAADLAIVLVVQSSFPHSATRIVCEYVLRAASAIAIVWCVVGRACLRQSLALGPGRSASPRSLVRWTLAAGGLFSLALIASVVSMAFAARRLGAPIGDDVAFASWGDVREFLLYACVAAPFGEELAWRGVLYPALRGRLPAWGAILIDAFLFAWLHFVYGGPLPLIPFFGGLALAWSYERAGSLWAPIGIHALMNVAVALLNLIPFLWPGVIPWLRGA